MPHGVEVGGNIEAGVGEVRKVQKYNSGERMRTFKCRQKQVVARSRHGIIVVEFPAWQNQQGRVGCGVCGAGDVRGDGIGRVAIRRRGGIRRKEDSGEELQDFLLQRDPGGHRVQARGPQRDPPDQVVRVVQVGKGRQTRQVENKAVFGRHHAEVHSGLCQADEECRER